MDDYTPLPLRVRRGELQLDAEEKHKAMVAARNRHSSITYARGAKRDDVRDAYRDYEDAFNEWRRAVNLLGE